MIFRRTIVAETRRDSTGAFPPLLFLSLSLSLSLASVLGLSPSVSLYLSTATSLCPSLIISQFSPLRRALPFSDSRCRSFLLPASILFLYAVYLSFSFCLAFSYFLAPLFLFFSIANCSSLARTISFFFSPSCSVPLSRSYLFPSTKHSSLTHPVPLRLTLSFSRA